MPKAKVREKQAMKIDLTGKFAELLLYIAKSCEDDPRFGATKLNKILFFADFLSYRKRRESITGARYIRLDHGPVPKCLVSVREGLIEAGRLAIKETDYHGWIQERPIALKEPNLKKFSGEEIAIVDGVIRALASHNATQVSELSHGFWWELAENREEIPISVSLVDIPTELSDETRKHAESLEENAARLAEVA